MNTTLQKNIFIAVVLGAFFGGMYVWSGREEAVEIPDHVTTVAFERPVVVMRTNFGDIELELFSDAAPLTMENFLTLSERGFYNGTKFHRVIPNFMIQGGDPNSKDDDWSDDGFGGPGYAFEDEINRHKVVRGALAMANSGPNTNGSQFFIVTAEAAPWLDGRHTVFGRVVRGMEVVDRIEQLPRNANDHPLEDAVIVEITLPF